jgi:hypothetical protein
VAERSVHTLVVGFDSAWTDNPRQPGAVCVSRAVGSDIQFVEPTPASFDEARQVIERESARLLRCASSRSISPRSSQTRSACVQSIP